MLWTLLLAQTASAMAIGKIDRRSLDQTASSSQQLNSNILTHSDPVPHKYVVHFKDNVSNTDIHYHREIVAARQMELASLLHPTHPFFEATADVPQNYGGITDYLNTTMNSYVGYFTEDMIDEIQKSDLVDYIQQDGYMKPYGFVDYTKVRQKNGKRTVIQQDSSSKTTNTQMIQPNSDWPLSRLSIRQFSENMKEPFKFLEDSGAGVDVYIIDSGVFGSHTEFGGTVKNGPEVGFDNLEDDDGHGTCVASLAAGKYLGVAKKSQVYSAKVMTGKKYADIFSIAKAINTITETHKKKLRDSYYQGSVINISLGSYDEYDANDIEHLAINEAIEAGVHVVVAAGNDNQDACLESPASNPNAITVGSSSKNDRKSIFSNYGDCVDIYAPGDGVYCASNKKVNKLVKTRGTSMASPIVTGLVAAILSYAPSSGSKYTKGTQISPADMKTLIKRIATPKASNSLLSTESIAYYGGTEAELDFFYSLLEKIHDGTEIQTPQFAVSPPDLKTSRIILAQEKVLYPAFNRAVKVIKSVDATYGKVKKVIKNAKLQAQIYYYTNKIKYKNKLKSTH